MGALLAAPAQPPLGLFDLGRGEVALKHPEVGDAFRDYLRGLDLSS